MYFTTDYISTVHLNLTISFKFFFFQFEQADEATRNRRALEIEKEDTDELQQKYQVGLFDLPSTFNPWVVGGERVTRATPYIGL